MTASCGGATPPPWPLGLDITHRGYRFLRFDWCGFNVGIYMGIQTVTRSCLHDLIRSTLLLNIIEQRPSVLASE